VERLRPRRTSSYRGRNEKESPKHQKPNTDTIVLPEKQIYRHREAGEIQAYAVKSQKDVYNRLPEYAPYVRKAANCMTI
jgi:hypothetical protein